MLYLYSDNERNKNIIFYVYNIYNLLLINHNEINNKENLSEVKAIINMHEKSVIIKNFNLYYLL